MPVNDFSVGRDVTLQINKSDASWFSGSNIDFALLTGFTARQDTSDVRVKGLDGVVRHLVLPDGWSGSFELERKGVYSADETSVDEFFAQLEEAYYNGENTGTVTITETIDNGSGQTEAYRFDNCALKIEDAGDWRGDATVKLRVGFMASKRVKV